MFRSRRFPFWAFATVLLAASASADVESTRERLDAVRERIQAVAETIGRGRERRDELTRRLAEAEREIGRLSLGLRDIERGIREREADIEALRERTAAEEHRLAEKRRHLAAQVRAAYIGGRQGKLRLLLSGHDPATLGRLLAYHDYYARERVAAIAGLREHLDLLAATRRELADERDALAEQRAERERMLGAVEAHQAERRETVATIEARLASGGRELEALRADEARLEDLVERLRAAFADIPAEAQAPPFPSLKGRLEPPVSGSPIAHFGQPKFGGRLRWQGIWLAADAGDTVKSTAGGRVVYVGWMHRYGLIVVLDHGDGFFTVYGHNRSVHAEVGRWVARGETIADAGRSGGHDRNGVYFEIRKGRTPVNPSEWLRR
jgi:septal ring factor EnvC (AmiA/AmiB activator)